MTLFDTQNAEQISVLKLRVILKCFKKRGKLLTIQGNDFVLLDIWQLCFFARIPLYQFFIDSGCQSGTQSRDGLTVSFGAIGGDVFIKFYDKAAEQKIYGKHWGRAEIQLRNQHADSALRSGLPIDVLFASVMGKYLAFKEESTTDSTPSEMAVDAFWGIYFVSKAQPIYPTRPSEPCGAMPQG